MARKAEISAEDFRAWMERMSWNDVQATAGLGLGSRHTLVKYKAEGAPLYIALACAALIRGLSPWPR